MPVDNSKYWSWGLPYAGLNNEGSAKYWSWGLPYGFIFGEITGIAIGAVISATSGVVAALGVRRFISAVIAATSSMYGNVSTILRPMSAVISATSTVSANILASRPMAAIIEATSNVVASLQAIFSISAVITGVSGVIADIYEAGVGPVGAAGRHLIGYLRRKVEKAVNDFLHIE